MIHRRALLAAAALSGVTAALQAQINGYAQVTGIVGATLSIGVVDETNGSFEDGDQAILMQMQDDVIGANLVNNVSFGNLSTISSAGTWEMITINTHVEGAGVPISVTAQGPLTYTYHFGPKCSVQLISFRDRGSPDWTTSAPINALPWNGTLGGVVALKVSGTLTLAHNIRADGAGLRRGLPSNNYTGGCVTNTYTATIANYGEKGEGIQRPDPVADKYARGKFANGGGGGNPNNAGGAGGGNVTGGGVGGGGYNCASSGGIAGIPLNTHIQPYRFFMGGGGGGGQQNNGVGGPGGAGGGIVIILMNTLRTVGPCSPLFISSNGANGQSSVGAPPDGAGGGGAGGSVYLIVNAMQIDPTCTVTCQANGGNGGGVTNTNPSPGNWVDCGGGGGGGGQGLVMCGGGMGGSGGSGWAGMSAGTTSGQGGTHNPAGGRAQSGAGVPGLGVVGFPNGSGLPVELLSFTGHGEADGVRLEWSTATEHNSAGFHVQRSRDGHIWEPIAQVPAAGESVTTTYYTELDRAPLPGAAYYRLEQFDIDGAWEIFPMIMVTWNSSSVLIAKPNPASDQVQLLIPGDGPHEVLLTDAMGRIVLRMTLNADIRVVPLTSVSNGTYGLTVTGPSGVPMHTPIVVQR